ncbi:uncharacterized protein LOC132715543 [Ruditapes philippinarum]|uniref:uncharacterized protein LOC132715543 n=1 Tax=Ruditapes philippinarum TaxID=129788 RepID=UPI00295B672D|nr:uncharacterized protein LOC132715543 [Ruditapes philippinarum]
MATSSTDVSESSDIVHEFACKPCSDDDKNIDGVNFCAECQTYFCQACVQFHNKCFKTHTIYNKSGVKSGKLQFEQTQSGLACDKHAGNLIQMYCREHDTVCCAVCIAVDHRLCKSADFIPKLAKEILNGRDRNDVKTSLEGIRKQLNSMKAKKLQQIKDVGEEKDENLKEIVKMKEQIIARVEEIERNSVQQVQKKHDKIVRAIKTDIDSIDVKLNAVQSNIEKVNAFKGDNEAKLFVVLNKAHEVEVSSSSFIDENGKGEYDKIDFVVNQDIASFVGKIDAFGNVRGDGDRKIGSTVASYSQKHQLLIYDLKGCHIETHIFLSDEKADIEINHATFSPYNSCMYISTRKKGLLVFDTINKTLSEVTHKRLQNAYCVCEGRNGQYFVCGQDSNNIFLVDRKNNKMEEILGSLDGIWDPISVMYFKQENLLFVMSASQDIKVYQLK